jgi:hypothetical protein
MHDEYMTWIKKWPTQFVLAVLEINFCEALEKIFASNSKDSKAESTVPPSATLDPKLGSASKSSLIIEDEEEGESEKIESSSESSFKL